LTRANPNNYNIQCTGIWKREQCKCSGVIHHDSR